MNYYRVEMYNCEKGFSAFIIITAHGPITAKEYAEYLLKQLWKNPNNWIINSIREEENF